VELSYSGISVDTVIIIGGANESHFPALSGKDLVGANIVHIGVRDISLTSGKNYVSFSRPASSISEIIAGLVEEGGYVLDQDVATNLLMGIDESTASFSDSTVSAETFSVASKLMAAGGKRMNVQGVAQRRDFPIGSVPGSPLKPVFTQTKRVDKVESLIDNQGVRPYSSQVSDNSINSQAEKSENDDQNTPKDWLKPKIFKGTSVS